MVRLLLKPLAWALIVLLWPSGARGQEVRGHDDGLEERPTVSGVLEVGYSAAMFSNVDINDAQAATKVWVQEVVEKTGEEAGSEILIFNDVASIAAAVRERRVDLVVMLSAEYIALRDNLPLKPLVVAVQGGRVESEHVLLVNRSSGLESLEQLKGKELVVETGGKGGLPFMWLDVLLLKNGLPESGEHFGSVKRVDKVSRAVLPVFFGQTDACIVSRDAFEIMAELNPQLRETLTALAVSEGFCRVVVCARKDIYEHRLKKVMQESLVSLHTGPHGQQLLTLFHVDQLVPFKPAYLDAIVALIAEYRRLKADWRTGK